MRCSKASLRTVDESMSAMPTNQAVQVTQVSNAGPQSLDIAPPGSVGPVARWSLLTKRTNLTSQMTRCVSTNPKHIAVDGRNALGLRLDAEFGDRPRARLLPHLPGSFG